MNDTVHADDKPCQPDRAGRRRGDPPRRARLSAHNPGPAGVSSAPPAWRVLRFHPDDPITFGRSIRASIEHGHANALARDLAPVAYQYQALPDKPFPPLHPKAGRQPLPDIGAVDVHRWRHVWRQAKGGGKLWGNGR